MPEHSRLRPRQPSGTRLHLTADGGAALDEFDHEPIKGEAGKRFAGVPNVILTPHISGVTAEANHRVSLMTVESVARVLDMGR